MRIVRFIRASLQGSVTKMSRIKCPDCNTELIPESYPVRVDPDTLVEDKSIQLSNFEGVKSSSALNGDTVELQIVESTYETQNHFKNRKKFESMPHIEVEDVKNGVVHLKFDLQQLPNIVTAFRCRDCDHVWDPELGDLNSATPAI